MSIHYSMYVMVRGQLARDSLQQVGLMDKIQFMSLGNESLYLLSHLISSIPF